MLYNQKKKCNIVRGRGGESESVRSKIGRLFQIFAISVVMCQKINHCNSAVKIIFFTGILLKRATCLFSTKERLKEVGVVLDKV